MRGLKLYESSLDVDNPHQQAVSVILKPAQIVYVPPGSTDPADLSPLVIIAGRD